MNNRDSLTMFQNQCIEAFSSSKYPWNTVYGVCRVMGEPQGSSTNKYYVKVYRTLEKLVDEGHLTVFRGTRDPSVYLAIGRLKGFNDNGEMEFPF